jgi:signal transduction histidine kinase
MSALLPLCDLPPKNAFDDAMRWIVLRMTMQTLLDDAEQCTGRIASLVEAVRSIARQERAEAVDIDVHEQLKSALGVLDHKLKNVRVAQNFSSECGHVRGYPSELAQVWVNLLDNAADAVNGGGKITIQTASAARRLTAVPVSYDELLALLCVVRTTKGVGSGEGEGSGLRMRA